MELGGNIELEGFAEDDSGHLVIIKKIVGNFAKGLSESEDFDRLVIAAQGDGSISGKLVRNGRETTARSDEDNLYFALDDVLKQLERKAKA